MNCCDTLAKILLIIFNAIFLVCGLGILGVGIWIKSDPIFSNFGKAIQLGTEEAIVEIVTWTFIGVGIFVFAIAFAGLIGTIRESKIIMGFYIVCVFIVFAAEASAGIYAGVRKDYLISTLEDRAAEYLRTGYSQRPESFISQGFNYVQQLVFIPIFLSLLIAKVLYCSLSQSSTVSSYKKTTSDMKSTSTKEGCCGVKDFMDYKNSTYIKELGNRIKVNATMSWACCETTTTIEDALKSDGELQVAADTRENCMLQSIRATELYDDNKDLAFAVCDEKDSVFRCQGCSSKLQDWVKDNMVILLGVGVGVGAVQLILMFVALWFCQSFGRYEKKENE